MKYCLHILYTGYLSLIHDFKFYQTNLFLRLLKSGSANILCLKYCF